MKTTSVAMSRTGLLFAEHGWRDQSRCAFDAQRVELALDVTEDEIRPLIRHDVDLITVL